MSGADGPSPLVDFVAGTAGGVASLLVGSPLDLLKTRLQVQTQTRVAHAASSTRTPLLASERRYRSAIDAFRLIVREEKISGLYKGVLAPVLGVAVMNASVFGFYGLALRFQTGGVTADARLDQIFLAGCASGVLSAFITSPIDLLKIREQMDVSSRGAQPQTWQVLSDVWRRGGVRGLYRGFGSTCIRDLGYGAYFLSYEVLNRSLLSLHSKAGSSAEKLAPWEYAVSGGLAGTIAWLATFPADVIKSRVQATDTIAPAFGSRSAFVTVARETYRTGGSPAFWAGVGPTVLRALPVNAVLFLVFEWTKDRLTVLGY